ncbi:hypothetical protein VVT58_21695 (plasmid) [Sphingobium sp. SJ10-10]|uniref:hypothetical protein n=1 Tax=unclassified Sphingobium TaxID=2611147 RepID=UPI0004258A09|nr:MULTISPECIES: hypothetical protein [unclassified Sphingobium]MEC6700435.1 hypothetical protein [Sphingobium sp. SJ10-10]
MRESTSLFGERGELLPTIALPDTPARSPSLMVWLRGDIYDGRFSGNYDGR